VLNAGGAMANQFTDRLLVNGNASSGTTILDVMPTVASIGRLTDLNQNMAVDANEGISLVQVAGNSSAQSFALKGGYVAAGPWRYDLYSFAPGASDAGQRAVVGTGNNYWDYRLGNVYICENGCAPTTPPTTPVTPSQPQNPTLPVTPVGSPQGEAPAPAPAPASGRLQVTPQIPSYLSLPLGLAYYNSAIIDNLHRRLGELRHEQTLPDGNSPEMFLRYIGSNMTYKSNVSFNNYGYDFDMDYSAVQIGGNLLRLDGEKDSLRGGVAYTYGNSRIQAKAADGASSTTFDNNSLALYLTWQRENGFYMDGVLAYGNHRGNTDIPRQKEVGSPKAKSWTASLESGYPFIFDNGVKLEPQAQLMFTRIDMDNFTDKDQTTVSYKDYNQTIGRLGIRADRTWVDEKGRQYSPYIRANYYQGWGGGATVTAGAANTNLDYSFTGGKFGQMGELGLGGTVTLKNQLSLYGEVDYRKEINGNGAKGWGYTGGVRWTF
jgi:autotransporter family porin